MQPACRLGYAARDGNFKKHEDVGQQLWIHLAIIIDDGCSDNKIVIGSDEAPIS